jgi:acetyl esterase/lipase
MTQPLDDAYANAAHIPEAASYPPRWQSEAEDYRARLSVAGRLRPGLMYGHGPREAMDLFLPEGVPEGLVVFVHGGYWHKFDRGLWSHLAEGARARGWAVAMPSYDLCPRVRIRDITRQIAQAVTVAAREVAGPIRLTGHSAGGHLVARMLAPELLPDPVAARLAHVMPISPLSDLRPLLQTTMNETLGLDRAEAMAESPIAMAPPKVPVTVMVGGDERPAFLDQARWLESAWGCRNAVIPGKHHFDVIEALCDPGSAMVEVLLTRG